VAEQVNERINPLTVDLAVTLGTEHPLRLERPIVVAAGLVPFALGTDTAGSGRVPAAFNHLIGFKPTKGRWSTRGVVPACRSIDCVTVFTNDTADAALVDQVIAGFDPADPWSKPLADRAMTPKRIGVPRRSQRQWFGDADSEFMYERALRHLGTLAELVEIDIAPLQEAAQLLYGGPWVAERTAAIAKLLPSFVIYNYRTQCCVRQYIFFI
jgi:allophanate hydrolase